MLATIQKDTKIQFNGTTMLIDRVNMSAKQLQLSDETGRQQMCDMGELFKHYQAGDIKFVPTQGDLLDAKYATRRSLPNVSDLDVEVAHRRLGYIKACLDEGGDWITNTRERNRRIWEHMKSTNDDARLSDRQVRRLYYAWNARKRSLDALYPDTKKRGNRNPKIDVEQADFIDKVVISMYMVRERPTVSGIHQIAMDMLKRKEFSHIAPFSRSTVERRIKKISAYERCIARNGKLAADREFPHGSPVIQPGYLLEKAELDHTPLDIEVVCEDTGEVVGRVWLTLVIDVKSRMILGYHLAHNEPNSASVILAVKHAVMPKDDIINDDPNLADEEWPCFGLFSELGIDNGMDLHAKITRNAMAQLAIDVHYNPKGRPNYKGKVERAQRTVNESLLQCIPGRTFSNYVEKGDYKSKKNACMTMADIRRVLNNWIVTIYHKGVHRSLNDTPLAVWKKYAIEQPAFRLPPSIEVFDRMLWKPSQRKIQKYGIQINNRFYQSVELQSIAKQIGHYKTLDVFQSEADISMVHVRIPETEEYIDVPLKDSYYARHQLSKKDHAAVLKKAMEMFSNVKKEKDLSEDQLNAGWNEILRIRDEAITSHSRKQRIAETKRRKKSQNPIPAEVSNSNHRRPDIVIELDEENQ